MESLSGPDSSETIQLRALRAYQHGRRGDPAPAIEENLRAAKQLEAIHGASHTNVGWMHYNSACLHAIHGDKPAAIEALREAVKTGYAATFAAKDVDLVVLKDEPEFIEILQQIDRRMRDR